MIFQHVKISISSLVFIVKIIGVRPCENLDVRKAKIYETLVLLLLLSTKIIKADI